MSDDGKEDKTNEKNDMDYKPVINNTNIKFSDLIRGIDKGLHSLAGVKSPEGLFEAYSISPEALKASLFAFSPSQQKLQAEAIEIRENLKRKINELNELNSKSGTEMEKLKEANRSLRAEYEKAIQKDNLRHLLDRVCNESHEFLLNSDNLKLVLREGSALNAFVLSIDIRRSTDLMLKAKSPKAFSSFITELCVQLRGCVVENAGVFDKFTGDGILAYFPKEFSGNDAGCLAIKVASNCHDIFDNVYKKHVNSFTCVPVDAGLGIGIDFGQVYLTKIGNDLTVVGTPVVYACRLNSCSAGKTVINQPVYEELSKSSKLNLLFAASAIDFKYDGKILCYETVLNGINEEFDSPPWKTISNN